MSVINTVNGRSSSCRFHAPSIKNGTNDPVLVLIPGNPGLVEFYTGYLGLIQQHFPNLEILCNSHAGYNTQRQSDGISEPFKFFNLDYQINFHFEILKELVFERQSQSKDLKVRLYFLSHSCGSYIIQKVVEKLLKDEELNGNFEVKFVGLICPTIIDIAKSESGILFVRLFKYLPIISIFVFLASILRFCLGENNAKIIIGKKIVAKPKLNDEKSIEAWKNSVQGCYNILRDDFIIRHALELAKNELDTILRDDSFNDWFFEELPLSGTKIWTFFARNDHWVSNTSREYIVSRYNKKRNKNIIFDIDISENPITHSFCVDQSVEFAELTCEALSRVYPKGL